LVSLVGVLSFESVLGRPVGSSSLGASGGQGLSAHWLAVFLLSVGAGHWEAGAVLHSHERKVGSLWCCLSGWLKGLWLNAVVGVKSIADLDWGSTISFSHGGVNSGKWLNWKGVVGFAYLSLVGVSSSAEWSLSRSVLDLSKVVMGVW